MLLSTICFCWSTIVHGEPIIQAGKQEISLSDMCRRIAWVRRLNLLELNESKLSPKSALIEVMIAEALLSQAAERESVINTPAYTELYNALFGSAPEQRRLKELLVLATLNLY